MNPMRTLVALAAAASMLCSSFALNKELYGVNYDLRQGPDWDPNKCKDANTIAADLKTLSTITKNVRTYSLADCDVSPVLTAAKSVGMTVWLGVWVSEHDHVFDAEVSALETLLSSGLIDENVVGFNVGSEAVYRKDITPETAIDYLKKFKAVLKKKGISTPVAITDIGDVLMQYPKLMEVSDVVTFNAFPFWERIEAGKAAAHFKKRVQPLLEMAGNKPVYITETGWATGGVNVNASKASPANAARYLKDFHALAEEEGWKYYYFAAFDTPYKQAQEDDEDHVEGHFGIFTVDRQLKPEYASLELESSTSSSSAAGSEESSASKQSSSASSSASESSTSETSAGTDNEAGAGTVKPGGNTGGTTDSNPSGTDNNTAKDGSKDENASTRALTGIAACISMAVAMVLNM